MDMPTLDHHTVRVLYDPDTDMLIMQFVPYETDTTVHYFNDFMGYLYTDEGDIVGIQIEAVHKFIEELRIYELKRAYPEGIK